MSESTENRTKGNSDHLVPRATVHKQILDTAESRPDAAMEDIASEVTGASTDLVEKVLEEYGDPAADDPLPGDQNETESDDRTIRHGRRATDRRTNRPNRSTKRG